MLIVFHLYASAFCIVFVMFLVWFLGLAERVCGAAAGKGRGRRGSDFHQRREASGAQELNGPLWKVSAHVPLVCGLMQCRRRNADRGSIPPTTVKCPPHKYHNQSSRRPILKRYHSRASSSIVAFDALKNVHVFTEEMLACSILLTVNASPPPLNAFALSVPQPLLVLAFPTQFLSLTACAPLPFPVPLLHLLHVTLLQGWHGGRTTTS